jgi:DNA topoisomerase-3
MKVCVAEKPSVAREIAQVLGANVSKNGYIEGNGYQVTWAFGHLCELKEPHEYNPGWKRWELFYLPMIPQKFGIRLKNDSGAEQQFKVIAGLIKNAEECHCPVKRLWISSLTEEAIREGFQDLKPERNYDKLYEAGAMRAIGDWLLGMNATRAYTLRYGRNRQVLSVGRVQTPTLALVVNRYKEITNFKPEQYWELKTVYRDTTFASTKGRFSSKEEGENFLTSVRNADFYVTDVATKKGNELSPRLFDLTSLQVECNKKFSMSADDTLRTIQSLYEKKVATYPRVDTTYLPDDVFPKIPGIMQGLRDYASLTGPYFGRKNFQVEEGV